MVTFFIFCSHYYRSKAIGLGRAEPGRSQGLSRAVDLPARSFDLARPGVAPPLHCITASNITRMTVPRNSQWWWSGVVVVRALVSINVVNVRRARLVLRWVAVSGFNSRCRTFISLTSHPDQLSLAIPSWVSAMSTSQRSVTPYCWGVKTIPYMVCVWVPNKKLIRR